MCDCISYNRDTPGATGTPNAVLDPRKYFGFCTREVCVDACIAGAILSLWKAGIFTRHCCCYHNKTNYAEVALHDIDDMAAAVRILRQTGRDWRVFAHTETPLNPTT